MNFKNVDNKYRPIPFWSWNEKLNVDETKDQINKMNDAGIGGFFMHARGGLETEYMGQQWFENVGASIQEAKKFGMHPWAYDENGWPSGFGAGLVNGLGLEYQQKYLRREKGEGHTQYTITNKDGWHYYYDVNPFYVDTLDAKVTKCFIEKIYQPYFDKYGNDFCGFFTDEPQVSRNGIPWSFVIKEAYQIRYGENLLDNIDKLFEKSGNYAQIRINFWKMVTDLFSTNFMKQIYDWCVSHGYGFTGHMVCEETFYSQLTSNGACMPHYEYMTIPGMDWLSRDMDKLLTVHQLASAARQNGQKQVLSETFALCGHNIGHDELKWIYEYQMVRGVNLLCQHLQGYSNRGIRKRDFPPAMYIQQPWWKYYKMFNDSLSRIGMMLSEGDDGTDVLVIHTIASAWAEYNMNGMLLAENEDMEWNKALENCINTLESKHINFHLGDETIMERHGRVEDGKLVIGCKKYSKVIVPPHVVLFDNTVKLLEQFKLQGGTILSAEDMPANDIINIPEITYCERHTKEYDMYYFVNSTQNTYTAKITKGNKMMDIVTGELCDFDGEYTFHKYESLVVIDDKTGTAAPKKPTKQYTAIDLGGQWNVENATENSITLDYCDYYFDGVLQEKHGYVLNIGCRALKLEKEVRVKCDFTFETAYVPKNLCIAVETPDIFDIFVNGASVDKTVCGYFRDKSFCKINIAEYVNVGTNVITLECDFKQSKEIYDNIRKSLVFESEKNKLTFDTEIEQIYLVGDFGVKTEGTFVPLDRDASRYCGKFVIDKPCKTVCLKNIEQQGFIGFAGSITVSKKFNNLGNMKLEFKKSGINVIDAKINGKSAGKFMWEPFYKDVTNLLIDGENTIELTLTNNLRNMQGPLHLEEGEGYSVTPGSFYKETYIWSSWSNEKWNEDYCFVHLSIENK